MSIQHYIRFALLVILGFGMQDSIAEDAITMRSGRTMRGTLISYTNGFLILEDSNRSIITGRMDFVVGIQFDAPPINS